MQTVETLNEGLKRAYTLTIPASEIEARIDREVRQVAPTVRMPGFRPGKVPANLIRKMHGPALQQEALNNAVRDGVQSLLSEKALRPAMQPAVELGEDYEPGKDAELKVTLEVLPEVPTPAIDGLTLERLTVEAPDAEVDEQLQRLASQQKSFEDAPEGHQAAIGDLVVMDFVGKVDGTPFDGGSGEDMSVELGSGRLIPGFEDQLQGVKLGEERVLNVSFPEDYNVAQLKGKPATFEVKVTAVRTAKEPVADEDFAKSLGLESLEQLRGLLKGQVEQELNGLTRTHMKRKLLDQLAANHDFEVPPSMVEAEFGQIWQQLLHETEHEADPAAARTELENERDQYRQIAERRVRLGLLLSEIGQKNGVEVGAQEMQRLIAQAAQQYRPEDRQRFVEYIQQDAMAAAQLRAPLYEDKVVDFLFERAEISDRQVSRAELEAAIESEDVFASGTHIHNHDHDHDHHGHDHGHDHDHDAHDHDHDHDHGGEQAEAKPAKAAKKSAAKKPAEDEAGDDKPAKKPAAKKKAAEAAVPEASAPAGEAEEAGEAAPKKRAAKKKAEG